VGEGGSCQWKEAGEKLMIMTNAQDTKAKRKLQADAADNSAHGIRFATLIGFLARDIYHSAGERAFTFRGQKLWNSLPVEFQSITNLDVFKVKIKQHFLRVFLEN